MSISGGQGAEIVDMKFNGLENREEGKYQESIKSSNTPDWITIWESDKTQKKHNTEENQEVSPFPTGDHKAAKNMQGDNI